MTKTKIKRQDDINIGDKIIYFQPNLISTQCVVVKKGQDGCWCILPTCDKEFYVPYYLLEKI